MSEDEKLPTVSDRRTKLATFAIASCPLKPWMKQYAIWLASQPTRPKWIEKCKSASMHARAKISISALRMMEKREDFTALLLRLETNDLVRLQEKFDGRKEEYMDGHFKAFQDAQEAGDYKVVAQITEPILDRISPKKQPGDQKPMNVVMIHLGPRGSFADKHARIDEDIVDAVIESEEIGDGAS